jgi:hypothetical protein
MVDLAHQLAQEIAFVHAVFERFAAVNEDDRNFVDELAAERLVGVYIHFLPGKAAVAMKLGERLLHNFAEMTPLTGVHHNLALAGHGGSLPD